MNGTPKSPRQLSYRSSAAPAIRKRVEQVIQPYLYLVPNWCRTIAVELAERSAPLEGDAVTARCSSAAGEITFTLPPDWASLDREDQELSLVFWLALDDLARGLASSAGPVVDAVREEADQRRKPGEPHREFYKTVLPLVGRGALLLATEAVEGRLAPEVGNPDRSGVVGQLER